MKQVYLLCLSALLPIAIQSQSWFPFQVSQTAHYQLDEAYYSPQDDNNEALKTGEVLKFRIDSTSYLLGDSFYFNYTIPNSDFQGSCIDLVYWPGQIIKSDQNWMSVTYVNDTVYWPTTTEDTSLLCQVSQDSAVLALFQSTAFEQTPAGMDSVRHYQTELVVSGNHIPNHNLSGLNIAISKSYGLQTGFLPLSFPDQIVGIQQISSGNLGRMRGFSLAGVYDYNIGDRLHYETVVTEGQIGFPTPKTEIITHELLTIITTDIDTLLDQVTYTLKRDKSVTTKTYVAINTGGYDIQSQTTLSFDTITWNNTNLNQSFRLSPPRQLDSNSGQGNEKVITRISEEARLNIEVVKGYNLFATSNDSCGLTFNPVSGTWSSNTTFAEHLGLTSSASVQFPNGSDYSSSEKELVYFKNENLTYGEPLPPVGIKDLNANRSLKVFPNPFDDQISISSEYPVESISINDLSGTTVYDQPCLGKSLNVIDADLVPGIYIMSVSTEVGKATKRIIKY